MKVCSKKGKEKLNKYKNLNWIISSAEKLPLVNNTILIFTQLVLDLEIQKI